VTGVALLIIGVSGTILLVRSGATRSAFALWGCIVACASVAMMVTAYYYLIATNFFI
jgi:hypothetical protein